MAELDKLLKVAIDKMQGAVSLPPWRRRADCLRWLGTQPPSQVRGLGWGPAELAVLNLTESFPPASPKKISAPGKQLGSIPHIYAERDIGDVLYRTHR